MELVGSNPRLKRPQKKHPLRELSRWQHVSLIVIVALLITGVIWYVRNAMPALPRPERYQAVFLDNGQVYFGKLSRISADYLQLDEAYYSKQQALPEDINEDTQATLANNVALAKVGSETYGPENTMQIRAEQVLFWQDLAEDSKVTKAIEDQR